MNSRCPAGACAALLTALAVLPSGLKAQTEAIDYQAIARIRDEGLQRSQVMEHLIWLADVYGPRVSGTPGMEQAGDWATKRLREWGLSNVHLERFPFGRGWNTLRFSANLIEPQPQPIIGLPKNFSVGTNGPITAEVVHAPIASQADMDQWRGKLRGKIVLVQPARAVRMLDQAPIVLRMGDKEVGEAKAAAIPQPQRGGGPAGGRAGGAGRGGSINAQQIQQFYESEGAVALLERGSDSDTPAGGSDLSWITQRVDGGTIFPGSAGSRTGEPRGLPQATLAVEHYNRMVRILERGVPVRMELDIRTQFFDEAAGKPNGFNVVAEIPGTDASLKDEVVMLGAHFDGVPAATGATDNGSGSAAMMEAMRILQAAGVRPRRTIRLGLWGGEEHGLLGSRAYAREHFGEPNSSQRKPEHARFSAYFNIDNGTGRIRGVWLQENFLVRPIFAQWLETIKDLGVEILGPRAVSGTDHLAFDAVGLPGFQFIQERYEYNARTHHSNMDFVDRVQRDDLVQMATVAAVFAFLAAQRDELLPRKPARAGNSSN